MTARIARPQGLACPPRPRRSGFGLVELMVVLAILAILAAIAWPSYQQSVRKGRRADAMAALSSVMQAQERWRSNNSSYQGTIASLPGAPTQSPGGYYTLAIAANSATAVGYTVQATLVSGTPQAADTTCTKLIAAVDRGNVTYTSEDSNGATNAAPDPCWVK